MEIETKKALPTIGSLVIYKSNDLMHAHIDRPLGLNAQRILFLALSEINTSDIEMKELSYTVPKLAKLFSVNKNNLYGENGVLEEASDQLMGNFYRLPMPKGQFDKRQIVSRCRFVDNVFYITLSDQIKEYVLGLKKKGNFSKLYFENIIKLKRPGHIRLFEVVYTNRFKMKNGIWSYTVELEKLKKELYLELKEDSCYNDFRKFNQKILTPYIKAVNKVTSVEIFDLEKERENRKVTRLTFFMRDKESQISKIEDQTIEDVEKDDWSEEQRVIQQRFKRATKEEINRFEKILSVLQKGKILTAYEKAQVSTIADRIALSEIEESALKMWYEEL